MPPVGFVLDALLRLFLKLKGGAFGGTKVSVMAIITETRL
jgi:hypothetical protein